MASDETFELIVGRPYTTRGGLRFESVEWGHEWVSDAPGAPMYERGLYRVLIVKGDESLPASRLYHSGEKVYIEGVAFGQLHAISSSNSAIQVTVYATSPQEPLAEDEAIELAKQTAKARGINIDDPLFLDSFNFSRKVDSGTLHVSFETLRGVTGRAVVGLYTRKVVHFDSRGK